MFVWDPCSSDQRSLADFVRQNSAGEDIVKLRQKALKLLRHLTKHDVLDDGYPPDEGEALVWAKVRALYMALQEWSPGVAYAHEPGQYSVSIPQQVRPVPAVLAHGQATCIDVVALLAAALLDIGLEPLILVLGDARGESPRHAMLGFWLRDMRATDHVLSTQMLASSECPLGACDVWSDAESPRRPFDEAVSRAVQSLGTSVSAPSFCSPAPRGTAPVLHGLRLLYAIDITAAIRGPASALPVIAVVGAKGGVGKTIIAARMAELIAETRKNVLVLDYDLQHRGSTIFHRDRVGHGLPGVRTVYDYVQQHHVGEHMRDPGKAVGCWDVTPGYLRQRGLGHIHLIPARRETDLNPFGVIADLPAEKRLDILERTTSGIIRDVGTAYKPGCVIIDCGAEGQNPLYSAALQIARYNIVVATPENVCHDGIALISDGTRVAFGTWDPSRLRVILNKVRSKQDIDRFNTYHPLVVQEDPHLPDDYYRNSVYFDLGYDNFSCDVRDAMSSIFQESDQELIPSEYEVWYRWADHLPSMLDEILKDYRFRMRSLLSRAALVMAPIVVALTLLLLWWTLSTGLLHDGGFTASPSTAPATTTPSTAPAGMNVLPPPVPSWVTLVQFGAVIAFLGSLVAIPFTWWWYRRWAQRRNLLESLRKLGVSRGDELYHYLVTMVRPFRAAQDRLAPAERAQVSPWKSVRNALSPRRGAVEWLRQQITEARTKREMGERERRQAGT